MSDAKSGYERIEGVQVGQYVSYRFFKIDPAWRRLPLEEREAGKNAFAEIVEDWARRMEGLRAYNVSGIRPEADFFLWQITERYDDLLELGAALNGTPLAGWLTTPYSYLATTKPSVYTDKKRVRQGKVIPREAPYLVFITTNGSGDTHVSTSNGGDDGASGASRHPVRPSTVSKVNGGCQRCCRRLHLRIQPRASSR